MNLQQVYNFFPTQESCLEFLEKVRWDGTPLCPYCHLDRISKMKRYRYHCNNCNSSFSVTVRTILHQNRIDLQKWFLAIFILYHFNLSITVRQLALELNVDKNTANRIILALINRPKEQDKLVEHILNLFNILRSKEEQKEYENA